MNFLKAISERKAIFLAGAFFLLAYVMGLSFPESWWGAHYLSFLPQGAKFILFVLALLLVVLPINERFNPKIPKAFQQSNAAFEWGFIGIVTILMGIAFHSFPIAFDVYGDAFQNRNYSTVIVEQLPPDLYSDIFSFELMPSQGRKTVLNIYTAISHAFQVDYQSIFKWSGLLFGMAFVFVWLSFLKSYLKSTGWKFLLAIAGISAPFMQIYYGHLETYAPVFFVFITWLMLLLIQLKNKKALLLWLLLPYWFVIIKIHPLSLILVVPWILACINQYKGASALVNRLFTWKGIGMFLLLPLFLLGATLYFFVLEDHVDPRYMEGVKASERIFLPMFSPEAPLDRYNLFSFNHIFDYLQTMLLWCPPAMLLIVLFRTTYRKKIKWDTLPVLVFSVTLILFMLVLFAVNPLLGMPMDWDLFSFPGPIVLLLAVVLVSQVEGKGVSQMIASPFVGLVLLCVPVFAVNASLEPISYRLESIAVHGFKTYYQRSNMNIICALNAIPDDIELYLQRKQAILDELKPFALPGKDPLYAGLLFDDGASYLRSGSNLQMAKARLDEAAAYYPNEPEIQMLRMEANFRVGDFNTAYLAAEKLVELRHPSPEQAHKIAIHCALEAQLYDRALAHANNYLRQFAPNDVVKEVKRRIENNEVLHEIRLLFRQE